MATTIQIQVPDTTLLTADNGRPGGDYPAQITLGELKALARRRLGNAYAGVYIAHYGSGSQVEVRKNVNGYHGRRQARIACYPLPEEFRRQYEEAKAAR